MAQHDPLSGDAPADALTNMMRPARVLLGWLDEQQVVHYLSGQRRDVQLSEEQTRSSQKAHDAVRARPTGVDQSQLIQDPPQELAEHIASLQKSEAARPFFDQGWSVMLADLRRVCALQPHIFSDHAEERAAGIEPQNVRSIAAVSLPLPTETQLPAQFDEQQKSWLIGAPNPNLRIVGQWGGPVQPGIVGFGFLVRVLQSFVQVANVGGRYVLRDGYHRAYGLLRRGVHIVPVFLRDYGPHEDLGLPPGLLPPTVYLGERPPTLSDYSDNTVAIETGLPASQRLIVINGLELSRMG